MRALRVSEGLYIVQPFAQRYRPNGEIGRRRRLKICFVKSFLLELPNQKVNSDNGLRASEL